MLHVRFNLKKNHKQYLKMEELVEFLSPTTRLDLKVLALEHVLGATGSEEGRKLVEGNKPCLKGLISLLSDEAAGVARDACLCLVNVSADDAGATAILEVDEYCVQTLFDISLDSKSSLSDAALMCLCNVSRPAHLVPAVGQVLDKTQSGYDTVLGKILKALTTVNYNTAGAKLHYLGPLLSNLSQLSEVRRLLLDKEEKPILTLLPFTEYKDSVVRRGGIVGTLRNCCFDQDCHAWLTSPEIDIVPRLLLPLAGPEELSEEDNEKLPIDLQWLDSDKKREEDPDIRRLLLEALTQFCATREAREKFRDQNVYVILRELHKWETDRPALLACENLVDLLIRREDEIGHDNLKQLEVPSDLHEKFNKMDQDFLNDT